VLALPENQLVDDNGLSKAVFRKAMRGIVPDAILDRKDKIGFETPERRWLGELQPWVEGVLGSERAHSVTPLVLPAVREEWHAILKGERPFDFRVWRWLNTIRWAERYDVRFEG